MIMHLCIVYIILSYIFACMRNILLIFSSTSTFPYPDDDDRLVDIYVSSDKIDQSNTGGLPGVLASKCYLLLFWVTQVIPCWEDSQYSVWQRLSHCDRRAAAPLPASVFFINISQPGQLYFTVTFVCYKFEIYFVLLSNITFSLCK